MSQLREKPRQKFIYSYIYKNPTAFLNTEKASSGTQKYFENQGEKRPETPPFLREILFTKTVSL